MPFPLHKAPAGLLELMRLRTQGAAPPQFAEDVRAVIVANEHYGADLQSTGGLSLVGALPVTLVGTIGTGQTPAGASRVMGLSAELTLGAAAGTRLLVRVGVRQNAAAVINWLGASYFTAGLAAGVPFVCVAFMPVPLILQPGFQTVAQAVGDAAGADHNLDLRSMIQLLAP